MSMDVETLHVVLQQSFSPDANLRVPAEATIRNLKHIKGTTVLLLQVAAEKQVSMLLVVRPAESSCFERKINVEECVRADHCSR